MSENSKKYYWIKLKDDFFTQPKIKKLRRIAGGDTYTIIYLKMQLLSLKNEGRLLWEGTEDNFVDEIALCIDEDPENVGVTVNYLLCQGLLEQASETEFSLPQAMQSIGSETSGAERVRRFRERRKTLEISADPEQKTLHCNADVTSCNTEKEIRDRDRDKRTDIELKKEKEPSPLPGASPQLEAAFADWLQYKRERRESYKPTGLKALQTQIVNNVTKYGEQAVIDLIRECMGNNWRGIIFDKLSERRNGSQRNRDTVFQTSNPFMEILEREREKQ